MWSILRERSDRTVEKTFGNKSFLYKYITILLTLFLLGVLSLFERVLLATVQYRHGPGSQLGDGIGLLIADGVKLYGKHGVDNRSAKSGYIWTAAMFC